MPKNKQDWQKDSPNLAIVCLCLEFSPDCAGCGYKKATENIAVWVEKNWNTHLGGNAIISADELLTYLKENVC